MFGCGDRILYEIVKCRNRFSVFLHDALRHMENEQRLRELGLHSPERCR